MKRRIDDLNQEDPERTCLGVPWDWRRPSWARVMNRTWNPNDLRFFTPKPFGHGHVINGYWLSHPITYWRTRWRRDSRSRRRQQ